MQMLLVTITVKVTICVAKPLFHDISSMLGIALLKCSASSDIVTISKELYKLMLLRVTVTESLQGKMSNGLKVTSFF